MKVLSIEQMTKLKELGVDTSIASMAIYDIYAGENKVYDIIASNGAFPEDQEYDRFGYGIYSAVAFCKKPVFTLQDIVELLPVQIINCNEIYLLKIIPISNEVSYVQFNAQICADITKYPLRVKKSDSLFNSLFEMLIWVIKNGYLKTK